MIRTALLCLALAWSASTAPAQEAPAPDVPTPADEAERLGRRAERLLERLDHALPAEEGREPLPGAERAGRLERLRERLRAATDDSARIEGPSGPGGASDLGPGAASTPVLEGPPPPRPRRGESGPGGARRGPSPDTAREGRRGSAFGRRRADGPRFGGPTVDGPEVDAPELGTPERGAPGRGAAQWLGSWGRGADADRSGRRSDVDASRGGRFGALGGAPRRRGLDRDDPARSLRRRAVDGRGRIDAARPERRLHRRGQAALVRPNAALGREASGRADLRRRAGAPARAGLGLDAPRRGPGVEARFRGARPELLRRGGARGHGRAFGGRRHGTTPIRGPRTDRELRSGPGPRAESPGPRAEGPGPRAESPGRRAGRFGRAPRR